MMNESTQPAPWRKLFDLHKKQLEEHRRFLSSLQGEAQHVLGAKEFTEECLAQTESMMQHFKQSADKFLGATKRPPIDHGQRPKKVPKGPRLDPSGLFVRDTKPTPVEELLRHANPTVIRTKRKISEQDEETVSQPECSTLRTERPQKRVRQEGSPTRENHVNTSNGRDEQDRTPNGPERDTAESPVEVAAAGDSFVQEVEEHLKKKALKKLKKKENKRKRESAVSDVAMVDLEQTTTHTGTKPEKKKRKKAAQVLLDEREVGIEPDPPLETGQTTPQAEKGQNKRLSPASQYLTTSLQQVGGRQRSKQRKTTEVI